MLRLLPITRFTVLCCSNFSPIVQPRLRIPPLCAFSDSTNKGDDEASESKLSKVHTNQLKSEQASGEKTVTLQHKTEGIGMDKKSEDSSVIKNVSAEDSIPKKIEGRRSDEAPKTVKAPLQEFLKRKESKVASSNDKGSDKSPKMVKAPLQELFKKNESKVVPQKNKGSDKSPKTIKSPLREPNVATSKSAGSDQSPRTIKSPLQEFLKRKESEVVPKKSISKAIDEIADFLSEELPPSVKVSKKDFRKQVVGELSDATDALEQKSHKNMVFAPQARRQQDHQESKRESSPPGQGSQELNDEALRAFLSHKALHQKPQFESSETRQKDIFHKQKPSSFLPENTLSPLDQENKAKVRLGVFDETDVATASSTSTAVQTVSTNPLFDSIELDHFRLLNHSPPANQFEEWIQWTRDGKMWKFPIDNDQDNPEVNVSFHQHVFLVNQLPKMNFPKSEPIMQFMRLVCLGLSQNPHLSVAEKHAHLQWYKQYFADKVELIQNALLDAKLRREREDQMIAEN